MVNVETQDLNQDAVLWTPEGFDGDGNTRFSDPVDISVRWEDGSNEVRNPQAHPIGYSATVKVDRVIPINSKLYLGTIAALPVGFNVSTDARTVTSNDNVPDIKGRYTERYVTVT